MYSLVGHCSRISAMLLLHLCVFPLHSCRQIVGISLKKKKAPLLYLKISIFRDYWWNNLQCSKTLNKSCRWWFTAGKKEEISSAITIHRKTKITWTNPTWFHQFFSSPSLCLKFIAINAKDRIYQNSQQHCRDGEYMAVIAKTIVTLQGLYWMLFISQKKKSRNAMFFVCRM